MVPLNVVLGLLFAAGLFVVFFSLDKRKEAGEALEARLRGYGEIEHFTVDEIELEKSFDERVVRPTLERIGKMIADRTPEKSRDALRVKLSVAGNPGNLSVGGFTAVRDGIAIIALILGVLLGLLINHSVLAGVAGGATGVIVGFYGPIYWLNLLAGGRRKQIQRALPDAMDLLTVAAEAGQSFDAAVQTVVEKFQNALSEEFGKVIREVQLGRPRLDALEEMGRRCGVEDVQNFVQAVIQSEQMGVGIAKILRIQAAELRRRRRQRAQEKAAQASLKMMLPMVGCIFPTLWIILLGPAILVVLKARG